MTLLLIAIVLAVYEDVLSRDVIDAEMSEFPEV